MLFNKRKKSVPHKRGGGEDDSLNTNKGVEGISHGGDVRPIIENARGRKGGGLGKRRFRAVGREKFFVTEEPLV